MLSSDGRDIIIFYFWQAYTELAYAHVCESSCHNDQLARGIYG